MRRIGPNFVREKVLTDEPAFSPRRISRTLGSTEGDLFFSEAMHQLDLVRKRWKPIRKYRVSDVKRILDQSEEFIKQVNLGVDKAIDVVEDFLSLQSVVDELRKLKLKTKHWNVIFKYRLKIAGHPQGAGIELPEFRGDMIWLYREGLFNLAAAKEIIANRPPVVKAMTDFVQVVTGILRKIAGFAESIVEFAGVALETASGGVRLVSKLLPVAAVGAGVYFLYRLSSGAQSR